jgi:hypothetical protein
MAASRPGDLLLSDIALPDGDGKISCGSWARAGLLGCHLFRIGQRPGRISASGFRNRWSLADIGELMGDGR